jgi:hypothetical protein
MDRFRWTICPQVQFTRLANVCMCVSSSTAASKPSYKLLNLFKFLCYPCCIQIFIIKFPSRLRLQFLHFTYCYISGNLAFQRGPYLLFQHNDACIFVLIIKTKQ